MHGGAYFRKFTVYGHQKQKSTPTPPPKKKNRPATQANLWPAERGEGPQLG